MERVLGFLTFYFWHILVDIPIFLIKFSWAIIKTAYALGNLILVVFWSICWGPLEILPKT